MKTIMNKNISKAMKKTMNQTMNKALLSLVSIIGLSASLSASVEAKLLEHTFKQGEVMCLVSSINQENNSKIKTAYFQGVFPVA